jgi:hypothetical protein
MLVIVPVTVAMLMVVPLVRVPVVPMLMLGVIVVVVRHGGL